MPRLLEADEVDVASDTTDAMMTAAEEQEARERFAAPQNPVGDLSDGGRVGGVQVRPMSNGKPTPKGRASARRAWNWQGSESYLPLAWNPEGTRHDGARRYMDKRFCLCCKQGGFRFTPGRAQICPNCAKNNCVTCNSGTDTTKVHQLPNGTTVRGWIIRCFYLRKEDVPFPARFYGTIDCFLEGCIRSNGRGFRTEADMRLHARSRHRLEYQGWLESQAATRNDEVDSLRRQMDALMTAQLTQAAPRPVADDANEKARVRMARVRAAKKANVAQPA